MSACNIVLEPNRALVWTDAASYDENGILLSLGSKCHPVGGMKAAVSGRGLGFVPEWIAKTLAHVAEQRGVTFDDVLESNGAIVDGALEAMEPILAKAGHSRLNIWITGWSQSEGRPKCLQFSNVDGEGVGWRTVDSVMAPEMSAAGYARVKAQFGGRIDRSAVDMVRLGVPMMQAQRLEEGSKEFGCEGQFLVGGHILQTMVTAKGVSQRVIHEWTEDRIGERIRPAPAVDFAANPGVVPMAGMNRAERRRLAKVRRAA